MKVMGSWRSVFVRVLAFAVSVSFATPIGAQPQHGEDPAASSALAAQRGALAESILATKEAARGEGFDAAIRADLKRRMETLSVEQLAALAEKGALADIPSVLGAASNDLVYTPVTPCRVFDSRVSQGGPGAAPGRHAAGRAGDGYDGLPGPGGTSRRLRHSGGSDVGDHQLRGGHPVWYREPACIRGGVPATSGAACRDHQLRSGAESVGFGERPCRADLRPSGHVVRGRRLATGSFWELDRGPRRRGRLLPRPHLRTGDDRQRCLRKWHRYIDRPNPSPFIGPTATVTVTSAQKVHVWATKALGSTVGASGLSLGICFRSTVLGSPIVLVGSGSTGYTAAAGQRHSFSLSAVWGPTTADTYETGLCGFAFPFTQAPNWNFGGEGYVTAQVLNP